MNRRFLLTLAGALLLGASSLAAQTFSVKGVLRDPLGKTVEDGQYRLTFRLYAAAVGGTELWSEVQTSVPTQHGVFSAELGTVNSMGSLAFNTEMYLGISVEDNDELAPRIKIGRNPYSISLLGVGNLVPSSGGVGFGTLTPQSALDVEGGAAVGAAYSGDTAAPANGLIVEGRVGVGTAAPSEPLEVSGNAKVTGALIFGDGTSISTAELSGSASSVTNPTSALITADSDEDGSGGIEFKTGASTDMVVANNGNIGIGTPNPGSRLEVVGGMSRFDHSGGPSGVFTGGNVGIGRISPSHPLTVGVDASGRPQAMSIDNSSNASGDGASLIFTTNNGSNGTGGIGAVVTSNGNPIDADVRISTIAGGNWVSDVLNVTSQGRVGIGTTGPSERLHVDGGIHAESTITTPGHFRTTGTGRMETYMMIARRSGGNASAPDIEGTGGLVLSGGGGRVQLADNQHMYVTNNYGFFSLGSGGGLGAGIDTSPDDDLYLFAGGQGIATVEAGGDVRIGGKLVPVAEERLRIVRGSVDGGSQSIIYGGGFTVAKWTTGKYRIVFDEAFSAPPTITLATYGNPNNGGNHVTIADNLTRSASEFSVFTLTPTSSAYIDMPFDFIAIGPR